MITFLGAGSWGSALANVASDNGYAVAVWARDEKDAEIFNNNHENTKYLPGIPLNENIKFSSDAETLISEAEIVVLGTGAQSTAEVLKNFRNFIPESAILLNISKGIEINTFALMSEVAKNILPSNPYCVLSGPSFAGEVARRMSTAVVAASENEDIAKRVQNVFMNDYFRVYSGDDVKGAEIGGSLKNIIALGAGMIAGIGMGENARAALITRGLFEMMKLGKFVGANLSTFSGLSGMGDLVLTCTGTSSRNYRAGFLIGRGKTGDEAQKEIGMLVEGISTTKSVYFYSEANNIDMPIAKTMYKILYENCPVRAAADELMTRSGKGEMETLI